MGKEKYKVAVHSTSWVTQSGHVCLKWGAYWVIAGINPLGPRGGRNGMAVNGKRVAGRFAKHDDAMAFAQKYAATNGYELI